LVGFFAKFAGFVRAAARREHPCRVVLAEALVRTRLCRALTIRRPLYRLRFFPTNLSKSLWADPLDRLSDEVLLAAYLRPGDVYVDVGANVGTHTLAAARCVGPNGRVYSFEPHPSIYKCLVANIALNKAQWVRAFNVACADLDGVLGFTDVGADDENEVALSGPQIMVPARCLDSALPPDEGTVAMLKIDAEGFELRVLAGAKRVLNSTDCVFYESCDAHFARYGYTSRDVIAFLDGSGFGVYSYSAKSREVAPIARDYISRDLANLLAIRDLPLFLDRTGYTLFEGPS